VIHSLDDRRLDAGPAFVCKTLAYTEIEETP
jgi:hypothetical protein